MNEFRSLSIHGIDRAHLILDALSLANIKIARFLVTFDNGCIWSRFLIFWQIRLLNILAVFMLVKNGFLRYNAYLVSVGIIVIPDYHKSVSDC